MSKSVPWKSRGAPDFKIQRNGKSLILRFSEGAIAFQFLLTHVQWGRFLAVLKSSVRRPPNADAYAGFIFSVGKPIVSTIKPGKYSERLEAKLGFGVARTPMREVKAIRKSNWADPVILDYGGMSFHLRRRWFLRVRKTCIEFERAD